MMEWESWNAFWSMGGAALYVWGSYGMAMLSLAIELYLALSCRRNTIQKLRVMRRLREARMHNKENV